MLTLNALFEGLPATMSSPTSTPGSRKRGRNATPGTREFPCLMRVAVSKRFLLWVDQCNVCVCVCDNSEQRGPHISSVSAPQGPGLLGWRPDANAHLTCHRWPESSGPSGHLTVLQPSSLRFQQPNSDRITVFVTASKQVCFFSPWSF